MDDSGLHLPLLEGRGSDISLPQILGAPQTSQPRSTNGEASMLAMPAEPTSGVWDLEVRLVCGRLGVYGLLGFGNPTTTFREGLSYRQLEQFDYRVLPLLSTALEVANTWKLSEFGRARMDEFRVAVAYQAGGIFSAGFTWFAFLITALISGTLDPPISSTFWYSLAAGLAVISICTSVAANACCRRRAAIEDKWLVHSSQKLHENLVHGRTSAQLLRAGYFVARGDPDWVPTSACCSMPREIMKLFTTFPGPTLKVARLQPEEIMAVRMLTPPMPPSTSTSTSTGRATEIEAAFDDDPELSTVVEREVVEVVSHVEDPPNPNRVDDPMV
jgi:hypothetical protein